MFDYDISHNMIKGLITWYPFETGKRVLFLRGIHDVFNVIEEELSKKQLDVVSMNILECDRHIEKFDYIISAIAFEVTKELTDAIGYWKKKLKPNGKMLIIAENRLAINYFLGDRDLFSGCVFDGIDDYSKQKIDMIPGRSYSMSEWKKALGVNGFFSKIYGVFPSLFFANILIADGYEPNENLSERFTPFYNDNSTIFLDEKKVYKSLQDNGVISKMANGFFIECGLNNDLTDYNEICLQSNRLPEKAVITYVKEDSVEKKTMWYDDENALTAIDNNCKYLAKHGVPMAECVLKNGALSTPFEKGVIATEYFRQLIETNVDEFEKEFDMFVSILVNSSRHVPYKDVDWEKFDPLWDKRKEDDPNIDYWRNLAFGSETDRNHIGPILERGYYDLTTINCVRNEEGYIFFDQEYYVEKFPAKALIYRSIDFIFRIPKLENYISRESLLEKYDLKADENVWRNYYSRPLNDIVHDAEVASLYRGNRQDLRLIQANRVRYNYSDIEYEKYFVDIFKDVQELKCYVFGSGVYAEKFLTYYDEFISVAGILDNNSEKWGDSFHGKEIISPSVLEKETEPYKVFLCIKYYDDVLKQLKSYGTKNIAVYKPEKVYEVPKSKQFIMSDNSKGKRYKVGYVAGVFDLFHVGHINLLRRAKEECEYLIVGVVSDEQVISGKKTTPYYPFEDRLEIVKSCKYVDEAHRIPPNNPGTEYAHELYRFDVQFSGSDYENDPRWIASREYLRSRGADLVFFPYTESTSSTKIKKQIRDKE